MGKKPEKFLVEFFAEWIRNEDFRKRVLYQERSEMREWKLSAAQSRTLRSLEEQDIKDLIFEELTDPNTGLGIDLTAILKAVVRYPSQGGGGGTGNAYEEGNTHVRGVIPEKIKHGVESVVVVRGHGWDDTLEVEFEDISGALPNEVGELIEVDSDINVWQQAVVKVTLPAKGDWRVVAKIASNKKAPDSTEDVLLAVT
jgi:hypothetical protein